MTPRHKYRQFRTLIRTIGAQSQFTLGHLDKIVRLVLDVPETEPDLSKFLAARAARQERERRERERRARKRRALRLTKRLARPAFRRATK